MKDIIFFINEEEHELIQSIKRINSDVVELKDYNFDGNSTLIALLISIAPVAITQLGEIIKTIVQNPSKGKIKVDGIEIEGFTYEETMKLLHNIIKSKKENNIKK